VKNLAVLVLVFAPLTAVADVADNDDLATIRSQVGWGASINPDRVGITGEGGYNGGAGRATANATLEATLFSRASVFANVDYGGIIDHARPALGAAFQIIDPRHGNYGLRASFAYKPEGFTEPEGELEGALVGSRRIGADAIRAMVAYGQDPDFNESDVELGTSYLHRASGHLVVGGTVRFRKALKLKMGVVEPDWDFIAGAVGGVWFARHTRAELLVGAYAVAYPGRSTGTGAIGLVSIGTEL